MARYVLSPRAKRDIDSIWEFSKEHWGAERATQYIRMLQEAIEVVAADPRRGRSCDEVREGYRKFSVGSHLLFFRPIAGGVGIVRILHQRMDFDRHV